MLFADSYILKFWYNDDEEDPTYLIVSPKFMFKRLLAHVFLTYNITADRVDIQTVLGRYIDSDEALEDVFKIL